MGGIMPSISISVPKNIYNRLIDYQDRKDLTLSRAGAQLIKMGFAWDVQATMQDQEDEKRKHEKNAKAALGATIQEEVKKSKRKAKT